MSSRGGQNSENIEKNCLHMQRHIFMRNVISQIVNPAEPVDPGVVRDHFPCWVWYLGVTRRAYKPR